MCYYQVALAGLNYERSLATRFWESLVESLQYSLTGEAE